MGWMDGWMDENEALLGKELRGSSPDVIRIVAGFKSKCGK